MPLLSRTISPTRRDLQTLYFIYLLNTCSIQHIANLFYNGSLSACYARLALLRADGLIAGSRLGSSTGIGSGRALLSLPEKGRQLLAKEYLHVPASAVKPLKQLSTAYGRDHHLLLCDLWVSLYLAVDRYSAQYSFLFLEWESERFLKDTPITVTKSRRPAPRVKRFISDGKFTIRISPQVKQSFRVELECDPLRRPQIIKDKLAGYFDYLSSHKADCATSTDSHSAEIPFILWVVPDAKSQAVLAAWVLELAQAFGDDPSFFWITTTDQITAQSILSPIWHTVGVEQQQSLLPASYLQPGVSSLPYYAPSAYEITNRLSVL